MLMLYTAVRLYHYTIALPSTLFRVELLVRLLTAEPECASQDADYFLLNCVILNYSGGVDRSFYVCECNERPVICNGIESAVLLYKIT